MASGFAKFKLKYIVAFILKTNENGRELNLCYNRMTEFSYSEIVYIIESFKALLKFFDINKE